MGNVDLFRRIIERGFNQGDIAVADEICASALVEHGYPASAKFSGPDILKAQIRQARGEVVDLNITIEDLVVSGDKVWARLRASGKSKSGTAIVYTVFDIGRFKNGKLVEHWGVTDRIALPLHLEEPPPKSATA